jgi:HEAT repeat protein
MAGGAFFFLLGTLGTALTYVVAKPGGKFLFLYGAILWGLVDFGRGFARWWQVRESRPFPVLLVGAAVLLPVLGTVGLYMKVASNRSASRERVAQMVREEQARHGVDTSDPNAAADPLSAYLVVLKNAKDSRSRREAAWRLGEMGGRARGAMPALLAAVHDPSGDVRGGVAEALLKIGPQDADAVAAVKGLFTDSSKDVWAVAIRLFAARKDPEALAALVAKLEDPELWTREAACGMLGNLKDNAAFATPHILRKFGSDPDFRVRIGCARALGALGNPAPEVKAVLKTAVSSDNHPMVRTAAQEALTRLGGSGS